MTESEMQILVILLREAEEFERDRAKECESTYPDLPASDMKDKIRDWWIKHKNNAENAVSLINTFEYYLSNKIHNPKTK